MLRLHNFYGPFFEGWYFKHQRGREALALIPGRHRDRDGREGAFVQVIGRFGSGWVNYPFGDFRQEGEALLVGPNRFGEEGVTLALEGEGIRCTGRLSYGPLTAIRGDIMGPFRAVPLMECRHGVVSMGHGLLGTLELNGEPLCFDGGRGYIETDRGRSFPRRYLWAQCNEFEGEECSVMASAAEIPYCGMRFWGCICSVIWRGREYRLATYRGARVEAFEETGLRLRQGRTSLEIALTGGKPAPLLAPDRGGMARSIHEHVSSPARFRLEAAGKVLFDLYSPRASFEYA